MFQRCEVEVAALFLSLMMQEMPAQGQLSLHRNHLNALNGEDGALER